MGLGSVVAHVVCTTSSTIHELERIAFSGITLRTKGTVGWGIRHILLLAGNGNRLAGPNSFRDMLPRPIGLILHLTVITELHCVQ